MTRFLFLLLLWAPVLAEAQTTQLDDYVRQGLEQNLTLRQQQFDLSRSRQQVSEAWGAFLPSLNVEARYTRAAGGRQIDFPVGDLLNPAYGALNDLLAEQGQSPAFPTIDNQRFALLREREQETKVRLVQPVYQPALRHQVHVQSSLADAQQASVQAARRQLVAEVKTSYFNFLRAEHLVDILAATEVLVAENLRVNERLYANDKVTKDAVYRAEAEVSAVAQQRAEAETQRDIAASYFNVLLDRPMDTPIERIPLDELICATEPLLASTAAVPATARHDLTDRALNHRDELDQLAHAVAATEALRRLARSAFLPSLTFVLDFGIQGTGYSFSEDADFRAASVVMSWNLFDGFQDRARVEQVRLQQRSLQARRQELAQQIRLQVQQAFDNVDVARRSIRTAEARLRSAEASFRLVQRKYEEGIASQIDFIDARTTLTNAQLNLALTRFDLLDRYAELERAAALYPLD